MTTPPQFDPFTFFLPALFGSQLVETYGELAGAIYILNQLMKLNRRIYRAPLLQTTCY
jgi:hypothetical protein